MCLSKISVEKTNKIDKKDRRWKTAYKVVAKRGEEGRLYPLFCGIGTSFEAGWNEAENSEVCVSYDISYMSGFHVFTRRRDAKRWGGLRYWIIEIKYRNCDIICFGYQGSMPAIVLNKMFISKKEYIKALQRP